MRIAFITPEFITDYQDGGGLGNYLNRMGKLLVERGHQVEIFVSSYLEPRVLNHEGIRVERVPSFANRFWLKVLWRLSAITKRRDYYRAQLGWLSQAHALADAMERRHCTLPFDIVQSADYCAPGVAVRRRNGRTHLVRCSTAADLYNQIDGENSSVEKWRENLERVAIRRADRAYAPSSFVAKHFRDRHGLAVEVVRPPISLEVEPDVNVPEYLPNRFLIHFGQFKRRKGTGWLCQSLKQALDLEPNIRMLWIGRGDFNEVGMLLTSLGKHRHKIQVLYPMPKSQVYAILQRADAAVLPSLVDNLPNTVIESLMLGIPVIGTRGASIEELVEHGVTGELVLPNDVEGLAAALVRMWRGESNVRKGFVWRGGVAEEMMPDRAIENLLRLVVR